MHEETQHLSQALLSTCLSSSDGGRAASQELFHNSHLSRERRVSLILGNPGGPTPISTKFSKLPSRDQESKGLRVDKA